MNREIDQSAIEARAHLRATLTNVEQQIERLSGQTGPGEIAALGELRASWAELLKLLALEPEPEVKECPTCKRTVMREARMCGHCWTKLKPLLA